MRRQNSSEEKNTFNTYCMYYIPWLIEAKTTHEICVWQYMWRIQWKKKKTVSSTASNKTQRSHCQLHFVSGGQLGLLCHSNPGITLPHIQIVPVSSTADKQLLNSWKREQSTAWISATVTATFMKLGHCFKTTSHISLTCSSIKFLVYYLSISIQKRQATDISVINL